MISTQTLTAPDGRTLHVYDTNGQGANPLTIFWHHGTPNIGAPPEPLFNYGHQYDVRWLSYDRPGYGGSTRLRGRDVAQIASDVALIAEQLGIDQFAVMGHSGGGPHALACAALLPDKVTAAVSIAGLAPFGAEDYFNGMYPGGRAELEAAAQGETILAEVLEAGDFDPEMFTVQDHAALQGSWKWLNTVVGPAFEHGPGGMIDDDLAYVRPWSFKAEAILAPVLLLHGEADRIVPVRHAARLKQQIPHTELVTSEGDGHISILNQSQKALNWLAQHRGEVQ